MMTNIQILTNGYFKRSFDPVRETLLYLKLGSTVYKIACMPLPVPCYPATDNIIIIQSESSKNHHIVVSFYQQFRNLNQVCLNKVAPYNGISGFV